LARDSRDKKERRIMENSIRKKAVKGEFRKIKTQEFSLKKFMKNVKISLKVGVTKYCRTHSIYNRVLIFLGKFYPYRLLVASPTNVW
jgi:hypothetical protein